MADLIHSFTSRLRQFVGDRRRALRRDSRFETRLPFTLALLSTGEEPVEDLTPTQSLTGQTRDLSERGLTLLLNSSRIRSTYLTISDLYLGIRLELPVGPVGMIVTSARFEQLSTKEGGFGYLLGVRIIKMKEGERERFLEYLATLETEGQRGQDRRRQTVATALAGNSGAVQIGALDNLTPQSVSNSFEKFLGERNS